MTVRIGDLALAALVGLGFLTEEQVADLVARSYGLPVVNDLDTLDVLLGALGPQQARHQHHDRRGPGRVQPARHQPGADQGGRGPHLRGGLAGVPAPGEVTESIRDLVMVGATAVEIRRKALEEGMLTLRMSGLEKIRQGITSLEEVLRETVR